MGQNECSYLDFHLTNPLVTRGLISEERHKGDCLLLGLVQGVLISYPILKKWCTSNASI